MAAKWFVYEILKDGAVCYVGKGCGGRDMASARRLNGVPQRVAHFYHEEHALEFERSRIKARLSEGLKLENVAHGNVIPWHRRTDMRDMAAEVLAGVARRIRRWSDAGLLPKLSKISGVSETQLRAWSLIEQAGIRTHG